MYDTILVPIDGSDGANRATEHALELAERFGATLYSIFVVDTRLYGEPGLSSTELVIDEIEDTGHGYLKTLSERAEREGIEVVTRNCHGVPHQEIIAYADEVDADAIVMGFEGKTHSKGNIGSVVERVLRDASRPVFAV
ncbi:universal stress protein [Halorientalis sp. IM1011]|uniref:universal stress protein n=1 Tax=Halorientalis sp. IM1011 TaxID=1932360 RepID=UPI00097CC6BE|nr:universal stress protein [Halorientalis sp. IM1011]AQL44025.1 universal stress protein [Halorientalis sp. IM1011]